MSDEGQYSESELIITPTHSIKESKGSALGLEGNQALYVVGAVVVSFIIVFFGVIGHWNPLSIVMSFVLPICVAYLYLYLFQINKAPGYQFDLISKAINGSNYDIRSDFHRQNPYLKIKEKVNFNGQ